MNPEQIKLIKLLQDIAEVKLISNKDSASFKGISNIKLKDQEDAVAFFIQILDIDMVNQLLDYRIYQDFEKQLFISKLKIALDKFKEEGNNFLSKHKGFCNAKNCNYKCEGYTFLGESTGHYFDLIFEVKNGKIFDIYECSEFKNTKHKLTKSNKIKIDDRI